MSITDARELTAAKERLAGLSTEQLREDLVYWSVAATDHVEVASGFARQYHEAKARAHEAETWASLTLQEIARRPRGVRREL